MPALARQHSAKGAEAFARYYYSAVNYAWGTPDARILPPLSAASCKTCANLQADALLLTKNAQRYRQSAIEVVASNAAPVERPRGQDVGIVWRAPRNQIVDDAGAVVRSTVAERGTDTFVLRWSASGWTVAKIYSQGAK